MADSKHLKPYAFTGSYWEVVMEASNHEDVVNYKMKVGTLALESSLGSCLSVSLSNCLHRTKSQRCLSGRSQL